MSSHVCPTLVDVGQAVLFFRLETDVFSPLTAQHLYIKCCLGITILIFLDAT